MSKKHKKKLRRERKLRKVEERSDRRSAEFLVRRLDGIQADVSDLIPDLQVFEHYFEISMVSLILRLIGDMKKKYERRSEGHSWDED